MAKVVGKRLSPSLQVQNNLNAATHFLSLPFYNATSQERLESFVPQFRDEGSVYNIPSKTFRLPTSFNFSVYQFRCEEEVDIRKACNILQNLDVNHLLREDLPTGSSPIKLTIKGMCIGGQSSYKLSPSNTSLLYGVIVDPSNRLEHFVQKLNKHFAAAGIESLRNQSIEDLRCVTDSTGFIGPKFMNARPRPVHGYNRQGVFRRMMQYPRYDVSGLLDNFHDLEIAKEIPIQKLSLCEEGRITVYEGERNERLVKDEFEEIASIPLPQ